MRLFNLPVVFATSLALLEQAAALSAPKAKNFIYVVPDGYGVASQTLARDYYSITEGNATVGHPNAAQIGVDSIVRTGVEAARVSRDMGSELTRGLSGAM